MAPIVHHAVSELCEIPNIRRERRRGGGTTTTPPSGRASSHAPTENARDHGDGSDATRQERTRHERRTTTTRRDDGHNGDRSGATAAATSDHRAKQKKTTTPATTTTAEAETTTTTATTATDHSRDTNATNDCEHGTTNKLQSNKSPCIQSADADRAAAADSTADAARSCE